MFLRLNAFSVDVEFAKFKKNIESKANWEVKRLAEETACVRMGHHSSSERWLLLLRVIHSVLVTGNIIKKLFFQISCWQLKIKRVYQLFVKVHLEPVNFGYNHSFDI